MLQDKEVFPSIVDEDNCTRPSFRDKVYLTVKVKRWGRKWLSDCRSDGVASVSAIPLGEERKILMFLVFYL